MGNVIFDDLGIDYQTMMSDTDGFKEQVYKAAESLKDILKAEDSVTRYLASLPEQEIDIVPFKKALNSVYQLADSDYPIVALTQLATLCRKLASDLEFMAKSKAADELANKLDEMDKRTAHQQYNRLRESFNEWGKSMSFLAKLQKKTFDFEPLPGMPGNYGDTVGLARYRFFFEGEDEGYAVPQSVCRRIGIEPMNLMDTLEYLESHPELNISVKKVMN